MVAWLAAGAALAAANDQPRVVQRTLLALYDSREEGAPDRTRIHRFAEMPLNYLGLVLRYHDIRQGCPAPAQMEGVRGVLTWFTGEAVPDSRAYLTWVGRTLDSGRYYALLGHPGVPRGGGPGTSDATQELNRLLGRIGIQLQGRWNALTYQTEIAALDGLVMNFERTLGGILAPYENTGLTDKRSRSHLSLRQRSHPGSEAHLVVTHPSGGYAAGGYLCEIGPDADYFQWYLNPFEFFRLVFHTDELPKPDPTTLAGRRALICQIDGDGWSHRSDIEKYRKPASIAAAVVQQEILEKYPDMIFTVAPIVADLDPGKKGTADARRAALSIFALPHVEAGNHGYSHRLRWEPSGAGPGGAGAADPGSGGAFGGWWGALMQHLLPARTEAATSTTAPWKKPRQAAEASSGHERAATLDLKIEIESSTSLLNTLLSGSKRVRSFHWSGDTLPSQSALAAGAKIGLPNLNGGAALFEHLIPSAGWVPPLSRPVGTLQQVLAGNGNESSFCDQWPGRYYGLEHWIAGMDSTEKPRRLRPLYLYAHMIAGETAPALRALLDTLEYARRQETAPIAAADYAGMAEGFLSTRILQLGDSLWKIENRGRLSTLRWDDRGAFEVDFSRSRGVLGHRHERGSLYVALDDADSQPVVALKRAAAGGAEPSDATLIQSRWRVWAIRRQHGTFTFSAQGAGPGEMSWKAMPSRLYRIRIQPERGQARELEAMSDAAGRLTWSLPEAQNQPVAVQVRQSN